MSRPPSTAGRHSARFSATDDCRGDEITDRAAALRIITRIAGDGGVQAFLQCSQPALGDRPGGDLLQNAPGELLRHLRWLEAEAQAVHDEGLVADPLIERYGRQRKRSQGNRLLEVLNELDRSAHE